MPSTEATSTPRSPSAKGIRGAKALADESVELVRAWLSRAAALHRRPDPSSQRLAQLLKDPDGPAFALGFVDRVLRPEDLRVAASNLRELGSNPPQFLGGILKTLLAWGAFFAPLLPAIVVPIARAALKSLIGHLIIDASDQSLEKTLKKLTKRGDQLNINLLGEAVLGDAEATRRREGVARLIDRPDVTYVSVKVSSVVAQLQMWNYDHTVNRVVDALIPLYQKAAATNPPTFINLDMEEYRDLEMTLDVFQRVLSSPGLKNYYGGIVLQAYLPEALGAMQRLSAFAIKRVQSGGSPVKVRVVKGANLQMEQVDAALHDWPVAVLPGKQESDTNYKRVLEWALTPERAQAIRIGVAGHNLFDLAFAYLLANKRAVREHVDFEMLVGMAPDQADAVRETVGPLILYTPVVHASEFDAAVGYLVRRLDENASPENFMSAVFDLNDSAEMFSREEARFRSSLQELTAKPPTPQRNQDRTATVAKPTAVLGEFHNEPDTDLSLPANQEWAKKIRKHAASISGQRLGLSTLKAGAIPDSAGPIEGRITIDTTIDQLRRGARSWRERGAAARGEILLAAAEQLSARRLELLSVMLQEAGKTLPEGDPEVSEAIDFARYYASRARELETVEGARFEPVSLTVVAPPWNFPVAIPTGSVTAALAAGSAVIIKPAPQVRRSAAVMVEALWAGGVPKEVLRLVDVSEGELGRALISHPQVDRVILTGGFDTAALFRRWRADLPVLAETSGKNALVITPSADIDLAVADLAKSAFGHAGQKCSAASLAIVVGSVAQSARFRRQLLDAVTTMTPGFPDDEATIMGPVIERPGAKLLSGLTELGEGETWLLEPQQLDESGRLWSPGIREGVRPGSVFHRTEYFGPVLGIIEARTLAEAVRIQNAVDYGLTAGIHSLDPTEVSYWLEHVEAGNLYVNRGITGAIVQRQPFGGWKKSTVGPTAKAGGPNYLFAFGTWKPVARDVVEVSPTKWWQQIVGACDGELSAEDERYLARSLDSDESAWASHYGAAIDVSQLGVERNVFRYRPGETTVRISALTPLAEALRVICAGLRVGAKVHLSVANPLPSDLLALLRSGELWGTPISSYEVEGEMQFVDRVRTNPPARVRLVGGNESVLYVQFEGDASVAIFANPVTESGRVEMLPFIKEQAVSITAHRFGAPDPRFLQLAL